MPIPAGGKGKADRQKAISDIVALENALDIADWITGVIRQTLPTWTGGADPATEANMADSRNYRTGGYIKHYQRSADVIISIQPK